MINFIPLLPSFRLISIVDSFYGDFKVYDTGTKFVVYGPNNFFAECAYGQNITLPPDPTPPGDPSPGEIPVAV